MPPRAPRLSSFTTTALTVLGLVGTALTGATTVAPEAAAIPGGAPAEPAPWMVQITSFHTVPGTPCSGVVVDPFWVATAGHCGNGDPSRLTLGFGNLGAVPAGMGTTAPLFNPGSLQAAGSATGLVNRVVPVAEVHAPGTDVMLLRLPAPAPAPAVRRAAVDPAPGTILRTYGFGELWPRGFRSPIALTGLTRVDHFGPRGAGWVGRGHTVRGGYGLGDSGGPLFLGDQLVGLHSGSDHAARRPDGTNPAWFESIPARNAWIDAVIRGR